MQGVPNSFSDNRTQYFGDGFMQQKDHFHRNTCPYRNCDSMCFKNIGVTLYKEVEYVSTERVSFRHCEMWRRAIRGNRPTLPSRESGSYILMSPPSIEAVEHSMGALWRHLKESGTYSDYAQITMRIPPFNEKDKVSEPEIFITLGPKIEKDIGSEKQRLLDRQNLSWYGLVKTEETEKESVDPPRMGNRARMKIRVNPKYQMASQNRVEIEDLDDIDEPPIGSPQSTATTELSVEHLNVLPPLIPIVAEVTESNIDVL